MEIKLKAAVCAAVLAILSLLAAPAQGQTIGIAQIPILALKSAPGLVMLTMSRDHRLFYAAYNDIGDFDGDGNIDVGFKPSVVYYGYFDSGRCYRYDGSATPRRYVPVALTSASDGCRSVSGARWHGNWLNWALTSRMDALRKVLYGGFRRTDTASLTVLEAANIPNDSHIWGKEYRPTSVGGPDSYNISHYTPLDPPAAGKMHTLLVKSEGDANTVYTNRQVPTVRFAENVDATIDRVWLWASSERPIAGANGSFGFSRSAGWVRNGLPGYGSAGGVVGAIAYNAVTYPASSLNAEVRVQTCVLINGQRESNCTGYPVGTPTSWKPTGVLHTYGASDSLKFGLLTGSYTNNYSGGVVRKDVGSFSDEINAATGQFSSAVGIVRSIDRITTYGFNGVSGYQYDCGFLNTSLRTQGQCHMWGAPVAEMMFEGLRYFAGLQPTPAFVTGVSSSSSPDSRVGLPLISTWANPFRPKASGGSPVCSRPVQMVIADPITSFDSDQLPGAAFPITASYGAALPADAGALNPSKTLNVGSEADDIWARELLPASASLPAGTLRDSSRRFFMGQTTLSNFDGNPTPKPATTFATLRGHGPDETNTQGSYYAASVAKYGRETGVRISTGSGTSTSVSNVEHISVALGTVIPRIEFTYQNKAITLVPLSKSVGGGGISAALGSFQATGLITLLYVDQLYNTTASNANSSVNGGRPYIRFMASFSDMDQGGDNEADANVYYTLQINNLGQLVVQLDSYYQAGTIQQNMGYIISGTTKDGVYLEVADETSNPVYYLDTLANQDPAPPTGRVPANTSRLPQVSAARVFTLGSGTSGEFVPKDPLWYAAKYGGAGVFDAKGDPTNYFKITNPADLPAQVGKAFRAAAALAAVASTSVVGVGQRSLGTAAIYQASYDSLTWSSRLYAFPVSAVNGTAVNTPVWEAASLLGAPSARNLYLGRGGTNTPVQLLPSTWGDLSAAEKADFGNDTGKFAYLLGEQSKEERNGGIYRNRGTTAGGDANQTDKTSNNIFKPSSVLGDIVNSDPQVVNRKDYNYALGDSSYSTFLSTITDELLAVGANDGFFRIFDAAASVNGGAELLGFMPQAARAGISEMSAPSWSHRYTIDGPVAVGHAKIAVPDDSNLGWRSVVIGTGGVGARTVFAINASSKTFNASKILWEVNASSLASGSSYRCTSSGNDAEALGNVIGRPVIGKVRVGSADTWVAIFPNGLNSSCDNAKLFVVNLQTGAVIKIIDTNNSLNANGLVSIQAVRKTSGNQDTLEYIYGADYLGNIWRFDLSSTSVSQWRAAWLYRTATGRPITAELLTGTPPSATGGGNMIYFGTGKYLTGTDANDSTVQAFYGIFDDLLYTLSSAPSFSGDTALVSTAMAAPTAAQPDVRSSATATGNPWYQQSGKKGWVVTLPAGDRVIAPPVRYTQVGAMDAILFTSIVPSTDDCVAGLDTWISAINPATGAPAAAFQGIVANGIKIAGGSPRGVFVLSEARAPTLYISQTVFNVSAPPTASFVVTAGGTQTVVINGITGQTRILGVNLVPSNYTAPSVVRQVWRQLK